MGNGQLHGISEKNSGGIFKFLPDTKGDYSAGQLYVFKLTTDLGDRTGPGTWVALASAFTKFASLTDCDAEPTGIISTRAARGCS